MFGGPCDYYEQVRVGPGLMDFADPLTACPNGKMSFSLPMIPAPNSLRDAYITRICEDLLTDKEALTFALTKIHGNAPLSTPNRKTLEIAFQRFFPERKVPKEFLNAKVDSAHAPAEQWKRILRLLCLDPQWQVI